MIVGTRSEVADLSVPLVNNVRESRIAATMLPQGVVLMLGGIDGPGGSMFSFRAILDCLKTAFFAHARSDVFRRSSLQPDFALRETGCTCIAPSIRPGTRSISCCRPTC